MKQIHYSSANSGNLLQKAVAIIVTAALAVLGFMFSAVLLAIILVALVVGGAYVWWKTRDARKQMREMHEQMREFQQRGSANAQNDAFGGEAFREETFEGEIIEGEVIHVDTERDKP